MTGTIQMRTMREIEYIKQYCDGKQSVFNAKRLPCKLEQTAYYDITTWVDAENGIEIESRYYIGD